MRWTNFFNLRLSSPLMILKLEIRNYPKEAPFDSINEFARTQRLWEK